MRHILTIAFLISLHASGQLRNPGQFVPLGGTTGQVLTKLSNTNWDLAWENEAGVSAGTLTGTTLASNVVTSSLTAVGTIATGTWNATTIGVSKGGTGLTALGSGGQFLRTNLAGTLMEWATLAGGGDMLNADNLSGLTNFGTARTNLGLGNVTNESKATMFTNPAFTGIPIAPTAALNTNTTQIATTAYVDTKLFTARLASDHAISSTTATEVTLGATSITAGTYIFTYYLLVQSATTTVSPMYGINFTGTAAVRKMTLRYPGTGTSASTGVADDLVAAPLATGNVYESQPVTAFTTASPNMGHIAAVAAINVDIFVIIEGIMIVTATGDLELWHSSETATSTTIKAGSSLVLIKSN